MNDTRRVMLLIDADNVSGDVIEQAVQRTLAEYGAIHVRRAYCNAEMAARHQALFKRLGVRPMVNLSTGKNSTDIALAVDALDVAIAERPDIAVLVSSDSDFAPLRCCACARRDAASAASASRAKTGEETTTVYDKFTDLRHQAARAPAAREPAAPKLRGARAACRPRREGPAEPAAAAGRRSGHSRGTARVALRRAHRAQPGRGSLGGAVAWVAAPARSSCSGNTPTCLRCRPWAGPARFSTSGRA